MTTIVSTMSDLKFCFVSRSAILDASSAYLQFFFSPFAVSSFLAFSIFVSHLPPDLVLQAIGSPACIAGERYSPRTLARAVTSNPSIMDIRVQRLATGEPAKPTSPCHSSPRVQLCEIRQHLMRGSTAWLTFCWCSASILAFSILLLCA